MAKRTPGLELPRSIIPKTVRSISPAMAKEYSRRWVLGHWAEIVGGDIARHVKPMGIRQEILCLQSFTPAWQNEIKLLEAQIVQKVNNFAGGKIIKGLRFTRPWEHPETFDLTESRAARQAAEASRTNWGKERARMPLNTAEMHAAEQIAENCSDPVLAQLVATITRKRIQMDKLRLSKGWVPCSKCGLLCEPTRQKDEADHAVLCDACKRADAEDLRARIRHVLKNVPWARMKEMRKYVPEATTALIAEQRALLVQKLASEVDVNDKNSLKAMELVMLADGVSPDQLSEDRVARTLYRLRFNLHRPPDYTAPRRYDIIKRGKEGEQARRTLAEGALRMREHYLPPKQP